MKKSDYDRSKKQDGRALKEASDAADMAIGNVIDVAVALDETDNRGDLYVSSIAELEAALELLRKAAARYDVVRGWYRAAG